LHIFLELLLVKLLRVGENGVVDLLEAAQGVDGTAFSLRSLEEVFGPWVEPLVWVLSRSATASAARGRVAQLAVRTLRVLLLHMSVEGRVR